ncbi:MAG: hypothetical protein OEM67_08245, partial [Thermoleophilia bacterium]|nr:hypothetical protein [Thermoleophilia bacterium]
VAGKIVWDTFTGEPRRPIVLSALLAVVAVFGYLEYRAQAAEKRFGAIASEIAHRDVSVRCQGLLGDVADIGADLGYVEFDASGTPSDTTHISREACNWLKDYEDDHSVTRDGAMGVHTLAHEAMHLQGVISEAKAECYGLQRIPRVAQRLGASLEEARALAVFSYRALYPQLPRNYRSHECVPGGALDLGRDTPAWP